jgi:hypothetical protein
MSCEYLFVQYTDDQLTVNWNIDADFDSQQPFHGSTDKHVMIVHPVVSGVDVYIPAHKLSMVRFGEIKVSMGQQLSRCCICRTQNVINCEIVLSDGQHAEICIVCRGHIDSAKIITLPNRRVCIWGINNSIIVINDTDPVSGASTEKLRGFMSKIYPVIGPNELVKLMGLGMNLGNDAVRLVCSLCLIEHVTCNVCDRCIHANIKGWARRYWFHALLIEHLPSDIVKVIGGFI